MTQPEVEIRRDVVFASPGGRPLLADAYLPPGEGPFPALVMVHGGGWRQGNKAAFRHWGPFLARHGYVAFASTYRLATRQQPSFPMCVWDVGLAVQHLRACAADYRLDPARVAALGHSAGAYLVAMLGLTRGNPAYLAPAVEAPHADVDQSVRVVVPLSGVFDLLGQWEHDQLARPGEQVTELLLGGTPMNARPRYYEASPLYHASEQNAEGTSWLVAWGTRDDVVDPRQSDVFAEHLKRANANVRPAVLDGAGHFWVSETPVDVPGVYANQFAHRLLAFLENNL
jgi:acetyl esterase/lipase